MQIIELSDHTGDMKRQAENARREAYQTACRHYEDRVAERQAQSKKLRDASRCAFRQGHLLAWTGAVFKSAAHAVSTRPRKPVVRGAGEREQIWAAGDAGEAHVARLLVERFGDDWTLLSGYHNRGGEIDQILVGPDTIIAMEIKNTNGTVHCNGRQWWRDKYDKYGNCVQIGVPMRDKRGRSPADQVNDSADRLESFLKKRLGGTVRITRWIVLTHGRAQVGEMQSLPIHLVLTVNVLAKLTAEAIAQDSSVASDVSAEEATKLIVKDHQFQTQKRREAQQKKRRPRRKTAGRAHRQ